MLQPVTDTVQDRTVTDLEPQRTERRAALEAAAHERRGRTGSLGAPAARPHRKPRRAEHPAPPEASARGAPGPTGSAGHGRMATLCHVGPSWLAGDLACMAITDPGHR